MQVCLSEEGEKTSQDARLLSCALRGEIQNSGAKVPVILH